MTEKDRKLIAQAEHTHYTQWYVITDELVPQAESTEAKERLRCISGRKFHEEEYHARVF